LIEHISITEARIFEAWLPRGARLVCHRNGKPVIAMPSRPLRDDEVFDWGGFVRPRYLIVRHPETYLA
jgi:hypothetical protein